MGKSVNGYSEDIKFFETYEPNADLSDREENYLKYGFFHLTHRNNLKKGRNGTYAESIEQKGLLPSIGENAEGYEELERTYFAVGADGVCGLINRGIYLETKRLERSQGLGKNITKIKAFERLFSILKDGIFLKLNLRDGIEYDNNDFLNRRNSHTIEGVTVPPSQLTLLGTNGSNSALDIFKYFYKHADISKIRIKEQDGEENLLQEFMGYIQQIEKENPNLLTTEKIFTPLKTLKLGKQNENIKNEKNIYAK